MPVVSQGALTLTVPGHWERVEGSGTLDFATDDGAVLSMTLWLVAAPCTVVGWMMARGRLRTVGLLLTTFGELGATLWVAGNPRSKPRCGRHSRPYSTRSKRPAQPALLDSRAEQSA